MRKNIFLPAVMLAALSLTFAWSLVLPRGTASRESSRFDTILPSIGTTPAPQKVALLESLTLTLDSPSVIQLGEVAVIRLTVRIEESNPAGLEMHAPTLPAITEMDDVFDAYHLIAEARLELPRIFVSPRNMTSQPVRAGQTITFTWSVPANAVGEYEGTAWFFLRFMPMAGDEKTTGQDSSNDLAAQGSPAKEAALELPVAAIPLRVRVVSLLGMTGSTARIIGIAGLCLSFLIALPLILDRFYRVRRSSSL